MDRIFNLLGWFLFCMVNMVFTWFIIDFSLNIPYYDDFDSIGSFILNGNDSMTETFFSVFDQYAEHRIGYTRAISLLYFYVFGELNFQHLIGIGLLGLFGIQMLIYIVIKSINKLSWVMFAISLCLLNFQYWENMMSAMTALQNLSSPFFSFAALFFLSKGPQFRSRIMAYLFVILTIFTSGNGVLLLPIGLIFIVLSNEERRQWYLWLTFSCILLATYFLNYHAPPVIFGGRSSMVDMLRDPLNLGKNFTLFLTAVFHGIGLPLFYCFVLGAVFVGYMGWFIFQVIFTWKMKHLELNWYFLAFVFLLGTAFTVALNRGGNLENMLFSRYKIYSTLLIIVIFLSILKVWNYNMSVWVFTFFAVYFSYQSLPYVSTLYNHFNELKYASKTYYLNNRNWKGIYPPHTTHFTNAENASLVSRKLENSGFYRSEFGIEKFHLADSIRTNCVSFSEKSFTYHAEVRMEGTSINIDEFNCIEMQSANNRVLLPIKINLTPKDLLRKLVGRSIYSNSFWAIIPKSNVDFGNYTLALIQTQKGVSTKCKLMDFQVPYFETPQFHN